MEINPVYDIINKIESRISTIVNCMDRLMQPGIINSFKAEFEKRLNPNINKINEKILKATGENSIKVKEDEIRTTESGIKGFLPVEEENSDIKDIIQLVDMFCDEMNVDPDLVKSMIRVESNFNPLATSECGAMGLMQLMPGTARSLGVDDAYDIYQNLNGGIKLVKTLIDSFNGDIKMALAAYNAGSGRVKEYGGVPPIPETENYISSILSIYNPNLL